MASIDSISAREAHAGATRARARWLTWPNAIAAFVLLVWLLPIKSYRLPAALPFDLEPYRIALALLVGALLVSILVGRKRLSAGGLGLPVIAFLAAVLASQVANIGVLDPAGGDSNALNGFFYVASFLIVFVIVCSVVEERADAERVVQAIVVGAVLVAIAAVVQSRTRYNVFDHLHNWIPGLEYNSLYEDSARRGALRVRASAQHPIALGTALMLTVPLAVYLASRASTALRANLWKVVAVVVALGALLPVARTAVVMAIVMVILGLVFIGKRVLRYWPAVIVALAILHVATPGVMGAMYKSIFPEEGGLVTEAGGRAGLPGSGRLADVDPGLALWESSPAFGVGRGNPLIGSRAPDSLTQTIIFDNQYMNLLVTLGVLGLGAFLWFLVPLVWRLLRASRRRVGPTGDLVLACAFCVTAFAVAMYFFDAFAFVQVTMLFFVIAALGLRALDLHGEPDRGERRPASCA